MRLWNPDPYCILGCNGSGTIISNEKVINGEYWCSFIDCDCAFGDKPKGYGYETTKTDTIQTTEN